MKQQLYRFINFQSPSRLQWLLYFGILIILHIPGIINFYHNYGTFNSYLLFSQSLLHGHLDIEEIKTYHDIIIYNGKYYLAFPPFPSLILTPFVLIFGAGHVNTVLIVLAMSCLNLYSVYRLLIKLQIEQKYFPWLIAAFFFGTGYWYALFTSHHVYSFAHITSCTLQLLMINEMLGKRRWWLVGLLIGCSFLTRQLTIIYCLFALGYMYYLYKKEAVKIKLVDYASVLVTPGIFILIYMAYNYARFGNAFETGYAYIYYTDVFKERVDRYGVFSIKYFLFNFYEFFIKGFDIEFRGPDYLRIKDMDTWGTSILASSPFFVAAIKAKWPKMVLWFCWLSMSAILFFTFCYHNNGFQQINTMRFSLDILPLLFVLTCLGMKQVNDWLFKSMIVYAILLNLVSFGIHYVYQP